MIVSEFIQQLSGSAVIPFKEWLLPPMLKKNFDAHFENMFTILVRHGDTKKMIFKIFNFLYTYLPYGQNESSFFFILQKKNL